MRFEVLAPGLVVAGLAVLAAALVLLQRLRVRHREVPVVTTLFWREAVEETRARVLVQRFRHPWAYLLVLAIASLIWLALAGPGAEGETEEEVVLLLDASAGMARGDRFERAVEAVREEADRWPRPRRRVVLCGAMPVTVLEAGEDALLLLERLDGVAPDACPATVEATIRSIAATAERPVRIRVFGDAPVREARLALLPETVVVERGSPVRTESSGRGVTVLGIAEPASGAWGVVDVLAEWEATEGSAPRARITPPIDPDREFEARENGRIWRDVPARGDVLRVRLEGQDDLAADDEASIVLPDRPPIRVVLRGEVPDVLRLALASDPAVAIVEDRPDVLVGSAGPVGSDPIPSLILVPEEDAAIVVEHEPDRDPQVVLEEALRDLALDEIDAFELAERAGRPIAATARPGDRRAVRLWETLLTDRFDFARDRAFPLFVGKSVRWLAGIRPFSPTVAAGRPVSSRRGPYRGPGGETLDPVGDAFVPPRAGSYTGPDGEVLAASLLDESLVTPPAVDGLPAAEARAENGGPRLVTWLALAALVLLVFEWWLLRKGRIP